VGEEDEIGKPLPRIKLFPRLGVPGPRRLPRKMPGEAMEPTSEVIGCDDYDLVNATANSVLPRPRWLAMGWLAIVLAPGCGGESGAQGSGDSGALDSGTASTKISAPGQYQGYSSADYSGYSTTSQYVSMRDGTRIAVDVYRPLGGPNVALPAILMMTPYHRASVLDHGLVADSMGQAERFLSSYGYVIVAADVRGTGASFGTRSVIFSPTELGDGSDLVDWIVSQSWCDGNVGMIGVSYSAVNQYLSASNRNPGLKAIVPVYTFMDLYDFIYPGGIFNSRFVATYAALMAELNSNVVSSLFGTRPSKPVDEDTGGTLLAAATLEHQPDMFMDRAQDLPYRDSTVLVPEIAAPVGYSMLSPSGHLNDIEASGVAVYNTGGWMDSYVRDTITFQETLANPSKTLIGPYDHTGRFPGIAVEEVRFFDRYLKGVRNGFEEGPPYYYLTTGSATWKTSQTWPPSGTTTTPYYFSADGALSTQSPEASAGSGTYVVDYTATSGDTTRWMAMVGVPSNYPDRSTADAKCLTFTTSPLLRDLEVTGNPVVHLFVASTANDGDFFVYLEDVDPGGFVRYLDEGQLRASVRTLRPRPWKPDMPWQSCYQSDMAPLVPGEVVELEIDLFPLSHVFAAGHRIRLAMAGADAGNFVTPELSPPPTVQLLMDATHPSYAELPIQP
jgi:putative CocE/NonD family hydrolase